MLLLNEEQSLEKSALNIGVGYVSYSFGIPGLAIGGIYTILDVSGCFDGPPHVPYQTPMGVPDATKTMNIQMQTPNIMYLRNR
jgi:hypothetical protein